MLDRATPTLRERLLSKIVMPGPATPCATWVGHYRVDGRRSRTIRSARPAIRLGGRQTPKVDVAPLLLRLAGIAPERPDQTEACHACPTGTPPDGMYRCVDLRDLRWGSRAENEADKQRS